MPIKVTDWLEKKRKGEPPPIIVIFGDEDFLKREALAAVRSWALAGGDEDLSVSAHDGANARLSEVLDDLLTPTFFDDRRLVVVQSADEFISAHRQALERYVEKPSSCGVLVLEATTWPATTKLHKAVEAAGLALDAASPKAWHVAGWCVAWARQRYEKTLDKDAALWLVELVGTSLGQLDQEISKLATFVAEKPRIDAATIDRLVTGTRTETAFRLFDMVLEGQLGKSLDLLDRQFIAGESPVGVLAMITAPLRRLTRAARLTETGLSTPDALKQAGIPPFAVDKSRAQLNHFGRERMREMYRRLLRADLDLKGNSGLNQRTVVETLLVDLARPRKK